MFDHRDFGKLIGDQKQMRKDRRVVVSHPMKDFNWLLDLDAAWHKQKSPGRDARLMKSSEFRGAQRRFSRHEILPEQVGMLNHRALKRLENHAALLQVLGNNVALDQLVI